MFKNNSNPPPPPPNATMNVNSWNHDFPSQNPF